MKDFRHIIAASAISIVLAATGCNQYVDPTSMGDTTTRNTVNTGARTYTNRGIVQRGVTRNNVRTRGMAPRGAVRRTAYLNKNNSGRPVRTSNRYGTVSNRGAVSRTTKQLKGNAVKRTHVNRTAANRTAINRTGAIIGSQTTPRQYSINNTGRTGTLGTPATGRNIPFGDQNKARAYRGVTQGNSSALDAAVNRGNTINRNSTAINRGLGTNQINTETPILTANAATANRAQAVTSEGPEIKNTAAPVKKSTPVNKPAATKKTEAKKQATANKTTATRAAKNVTAANKPNTVNAAKKTTTVNTVNNANSTQVKNNQQNSRQVNQNTAANTTANTAGTTRQGQQATGKVFVGGNTNGNIAPINNNTVRRSVTQPSNLVGNRTDSHLTALRSGTANGVNSVSPGTAAVGSTFRSGGSVTSNTLTAGSGSYGQRAFLNNNNAGWSSIPADYNIPSGRNGYINRSVSINGLASPAGSVSRPVTRSLTNRLYAGNTEGSVGNYVDNLTVRNSIRDTGLRNYGYSYAYPNSFNGVSQGYFNAPSGTYTSNDASMLSTYGAGPDGMVDFGNGVTVYGANVHKAT